MKDTILSNVETATHLGIKHSKTNKKNHYEYVESSDRRKMLYMNVSIFK
jgi:hypothetical protein